MTTTILPMRDRKAAERDGCGADPGSEPPQPAIAPIREELASPRRRRKSLRSSWPELCGGGAMPELHQKCTWCENYDVATPHRVAVASVGRARRSAPFCRRVGRLQLLLTALSRRS